MKTTPSKVTEEKISAGQIGKFQELLGSALRKSEFDQESTQKVLETQGGLLVEKFVDLIHVEIETIATATMFSRKAKVNRNRSWQEAIEATGRTQYTNREVVDSIPKCEGDEVEVVFFKPDLSQRNGRISDDDLEKEFDLRGLKHADPISVAAVNEADPAFADKKPHGTHWKDAKGNWCYAAFDRLHGERRVLVNRLDDDWNDDWWFAGVRK